MRKAIIIIGLFLTFLITYFLQSNFFSWFTIAGVKPNLFIILAIFISLFAGLKTGIGYGIFFGIFLDIVLGKSFGINTTMFIIISIIAGYFEKNFSKDSRFTIMIMSVIGTLVFEIGSYILNILFLNINIEIIYFIKILAIEAIYNAIITLILYPLIITMGYKIEDIFKEQNILTKYF